MKLVGDAVRQGQFYIQDKGNQSMSRGLKLIGLTSWGYVKNNMNLINTDPNTLHSGKYNSNLEIRKGDNVPLKGDHTHFLLIDDGSRYRFFGKYAEFITRFERMVRDPAPAVSINYKYYRHSSIYAVNVGTQKQNRGSKNRVNRGYLLVLKRRKI